MAFIPVPDTCMFELRFTLQGEHVENTLYGHLTGGWSASTARNVGDALIQWWIDNMSASLSDQISLDSVHCTDLSSSTGFSTDAVPETAPVGAVGGQCLPNNVAICISFRSQARGRSGRGRNYVCGIPDTHVSANTLDSADGIAFVDAYKLVDDVMSDFDATWVIVSRFLDGLPRDEGITRLITSVLLVDLTVDSQRRRLPGRGT